MTRVHDMGGRFGDGPVIPDPAEGPVFTADWHARALAVTLACGALGQWNIDISRHARERLSPQDYTGFSYYEIWISALTDLLVERGVLTRADLSDQGTKTGQGDDTVHPLAGRMLKAEAVVAVLAQGGPANRDSDTAPKFSAGQAVRCRHPAESGLVDGGHTRLPVYAAGARGYIHRLHGTHVLPDSNAHDLGEAPEPLYAVRFAASELWAHPEHRDDQVILDLWQSYLEPL
ncbi:nitrile hydratase subunit beta [Parasedimentitalea marina]|uniref:Nitrile hydratase subunit beta n=1 Tax=Parasedimentitalea marina TaxID=2483033 RepID=A0A3T0N545_9RHOB|nr:nitrile hydratase subunit beta [Parasedimentitalea marina]AZV79134.1 nitrile hydratase subunit beta [Parasedimentitalea marina]